MESRAKLLGHSIHQMLIVFPLGLLSTAIVFDAIYLFTHQPRWADIGFWMIVAGVLGGVPTALTGWIDWSGIPAGTRASRVGLVHGLGNAVVLALFVADAWLRWDEPSRPSTAALACGGGGLLLALFTGWLGGELVDRLGVGVDRGAHVNAPSSLSGLPATVQNPHGSETGL